MLRAGQWEWYFPDEGEDSIAQHVGYSQPAVSAIQRHANVMKREAQAILDMHRDNRNRVEIGVVHMGEDHIGHTAKLDSTIYLQVTDEGRKHPDEGKEDASGNVSTNRYRAALSVEYGHYTGGVPDRPIGPRTRRQHRRTFVKGIGALSGAVKKARANRRMSIK